MATDNVNSLLIATDSINSINFFTVFNYSLYFCMYFITDVMFETKIFYFDFLRVAAAFGSEDFGPISGCVAPASSGAVGSMMGRNRGIQGHQNSCYLDATLFSMFAFTRYALRIFSMFAFTRYALRLFSMYAFTRYALTNYVQCSSAVFQLAKINS